MFSHESDNAKFTFNKFQRSDRNTISQNAINLIG